MNDEQPDKPDQLTVFQQLILWLALVAIISVMHCQTVGTIVAAIEELKQHT